MGRTALIIGGAVAKGAFAAGAIDTLMASGVRVHRIVATSSGALNGVVLASAIRRGQPQSAGPLLTRLWRTEADWTKVFHTRFLDALRGRALSDSTRIAELLARTVHPTPADGPHEDVTLSVVVSPARGRVVPLGGQPATTYEKVLRFDGPMFDTQAGLESVFLGAEASAALPGVFMPVEIAGLGPCFDGGAVDNAPVGTAIDSDDDDTEPVDRVIVITHTPALQHGDPPLEGLGLIGHLAEILVGERLYRDLKSTLATNQQVAALAALRAQGVLTPEAHEAVLRVFSTRGPLHHVDLVTIRPDAPLPANAFDGFRDPAVRETYIAMGTEAARKVLTTQSASLFTVPPDGSH